MSIPKLFNLSNLPPAQDLLEWRARILDGILRGIFIAWLFALAGGINNVIEAYHAESALNKNSLGIALTTIAIYISVTILIMTITFVRKLGYVWRAGILLFVFYVLGTIGMVLSSFSGDGRIFLFAFVILSAVFFEARFSLFTLVFSMMTLAIVGWLQIQEVVVVPAERQVNSTDVGAWISGSIVFLILSIAAFISITYLLRAFVESLSQTQTKARELERLYAAARDMAASMMDSSALLEALVRHVTEAVDVTSCYIVSIDREYARLTVLAEFWGEAAPDAERKSDLGRDYRLANYPAIMKSILACDSAIIHKDDESLSKEEIDQFNDYSVETMLFIPIMAHGQLLGELEIWESRHRREFTQAEKNLIQAMAAQAGSIIENAQLFAVTRRRAEETAALLETSLALNRLDLEATLQDIGEHACKLFSGGCRIFLLEPDNETLRCVFVLEEDAEAIRGLTLKVGQGITGHVALQGEAEIVTDTLEDSRAFQVPGTNRIPEMMMFAPLHERQRLIGVMSVQRAGDEHPFTQADLDLLKGFASMAASAISNASLFEKLEEREAYFRAIVENSAEGVAILDREGNFRYVAPAEEKLTGYSIEEALGNNAFRYIHPDDVLNILGAITEGMKQDGSVKTLEYRLQRKDGSWGHFEVTGQNMLHDPHLAGIVIHYRDVTERKLAEEALAQREAYFRALFENAAEDVAVFDANGNFIYVSPTEKKILGHIPQEVIGEYAFSVTHPNDLLRAQAALEESIQKPGELIVVEYRALQADKTWRCLEVSLKNLLADSNVRGIVGNFRDITERKRAEKALQRHTQELETLVCVSTALRAASSVAAMIPILVQHAVQIVGGTIGSIYLLEQETGEFVSSGWYRVEGDSRPEFHRDTMVRHHTREGITGHVATTRQVYITEDLPNDPIAKVLPGESLRLRDVHGNISLPLIAQEQIIGVLHVGVAQSRSFTETEIRMLTAIAEMAGNAIHRSTLHDKTLQQAEELTLAYDKTLEGWARALELRDELTEGHTRRVTLMTVKLARRAGIPEGELEHVYRGAILHDIGKIGVPDSILGKPGGLTLAEKEIMHRHPQHAYDMISRIPFLHAAIDIPYCHHEHWDGSGYPRGLKGEEIPLAARIFALVDVWDALTSDRPYRNAWSEKKALDYIVSQSGKYFDPDITKIFLKLIEEEKADD